MSEVRRFACLLVLSFGVAHQAWAVPEAGNTTPYDALRAAIAAARYEPGDANSSATQISYPLGKSSIFINFTGCVQSQRCTGMGLYAPLSKGPVRIALQYLLSENPPPVAQIGVPGAFNSMEDIAPLAAMVSIPATMDNVRPLLDAIPEFVQEARAAEADIQRENACRVPGAPHVALGEKNGVGEDTAILYLSGSPGHTSLLEITLYRKGSGYTVGDFRVRIADPIFTGDGQLETMKVDGKYDFDMASSTQRPGLSVGVFQKYGDELKAITDRILAGKTATVTILSYPDRKPLLTRSFDLSPIRPELARLQSTASWACATP